MLYIIYKYIIYKYVIYQLYKCKTTDAFLFEKSVCSFTFIYLPRVSIVEVNGFNRML